MRAFRYPVAAVLLLLATPLAAQVARTTSCPGHRAPMADLGIDDWYCDCTFQISTSDDGEQRWSFRGEPTLHGIRPGGPADGRIRDGDVLVAVDGILITTREGGARLARLTPGQPVGLTVRRNGAERQVRVTPAASCPPADAGAPVAPSVTIVGPSVPAPAVARVPDQPAPPSGVTVAAPAVAPTPQPPALADMAPAPALPRARSWFGFGITCNDCTMSADDQGWQFRRYPSVYSVDPGGPAARAGLRQGDVLLAIDGVSLLTDAGGSRFSEVDPGETVRWTYRRGGTTRTVAIRAESAPGVRAMQMEADEDAQRAAALALTDSMLQRLRETRTTEAAVTREQREAMARAVQSELAAIQQRAVVARLAPMMETDAPSRLRYTGSLGNVDVDVRGPGSVVVTRDEGTGELVINTGDAVIRLRKKD